MLGAGHGRESLALALARLEEVKRRKDEAYRLLLAYAECEEAGISDTMPYSEYCFLMEKNGVGHINGNFTNGLIALRQRALAAAKAAEENT